MKSRVLIYYYGVLGLVWLNVFIVFFMTLDIINEDWIKPSSDEKPKVANQVENASYW